MAKLPTIKEMAEEVAKESIERIYAEKPELKELSEAYQDGYEQGKADAIDECIKIMQKMFEYTDNQGLPHYALYSWINFTSIRDTLEPLKELSNDR